MATTSTFCSVRCRNQYIGRTSREKNRLAQLRPEVRARKSAAQTAAFRNTETQYKHNASIRQTYLDGRVSWNSGLTKMTSNAVAVNAQRTAQQVQSLWDSGHYQSAVENGSYTKTAAQKLARKNAMQALSFKIIRSKYHVPPDLTQDEASRHIGDQIRQEFSAEGYTITVDQHIGTTDFVYFECAKGHKGRMLLNWWRSGSRCRMCGHLLSKGENEVFAYCQTLSANVLQSVRPSWLAGKEIDIYFSDQSIGIEYCGLYWHSTQFKEKQYHAEKFQQCAENGVRLITVYSDEWETKRPLLEKMIAYRCGASAGTKIRASDCQVITIDSQEAKHFAERFHIGGAAASSYRLALTYGSDLVALMTFRTPYTKITNHAIELARFCLNYDFQVYGAFAKLLRHSIPLLHAQGFTHLLSYSDCRFGQGDVYRANGFRHLRTTPPGYTYTDGRVREFRFKHRKSRHLLNIGNTEREQTQAQHLFPIYDCGHHVWERHMFLR